MKNVVFLMIDSLRFDVINAIEPREEGFMALRGMRENIETPSFDYLVENGASIPRLHAPFAATPPSTSSALTGLYPREHGVCGFHRPLKDDVKTLPEYFSEAGFHTVLFNGIDVFSINGIGDRFDEYVYGSLEDMTHIIEKKNKQNIPVFSFFHTMDVHRPYFLSRYPPRPSAHQFSMEFLDRWSDRLETPVPESLSETFERSKDMLGRYKSMGTTAWEAMQEIHYHFEEDTIDLDNPVDKLSRMYRRGVEWFDENHLSHYVNFLREYDDGDIVTALTGDHGEAVRSIQGEQTFYHGGKPVQDLIRVPGIVSGSEIDRDKYEEWDLTSLVDFLPTILSIAGIDYDESEVSGLDLNGSPPTTRRIYSEFSQHLANQEFPRETVLNWHTVVTDSGDKYYRMGLPVEENDFDRSMKRFMEITTRKLCISRPGEESYDFWLSQLDNRDEGQLKDEYYSAIQKQCSTDDPELYRWDEDHFENHDLLASGDEEAQKRATELDDILCNRFPDPVEIAWEQDEVDVSQSDEEEVTEGLKGLGYL